MILRNAIFIPMLGGAKVDSIPRRIENPLIDHAKCRLADFIVIPNVIGASLLLCANKMLPDSSLPLHVPLKLC